PPIAKSRENTSDLPGAQKNTPKPEMTSSGLGAAFAGSVLIFQFHILHICDHHMTRRMGDGDGRFGFHHNILGSYSTGPEYRHFSVADCYHFAEIRFIDILDADRFRRSDMYRRSVNAGHLSCDQHCPGDQIVRDRAHAYHHISVENACRLTGNIRLVHGNVAAFLNVTHRNVRLQKRRLKRKTAADQETYKIILPEFG